jgi:uncharacterized protein (TIGR01777 family)
VSAWLERPGALTRLTPPGLATAEAPAEGGTRADRLVGVRLGPGVLPTPLRPRWLLRHAEQETPTWFVDQQVRGPFRTWRHEHRLEEGPTGTIVHDRLEIELPRHLERWEPRVGASVRGMLDFRARQLRDDLAFHSRWSDRRRLTVAIAGSSGLIGTQLTALLRTGGHTVLPLVRGREAGPDEIPWDPRAGRLDPADLEGVDVVVNLGGRTIATRWTAAARAEIRASRLEGTALLARTLARMSDGPEALVQASAIGIYGPRRPGEVLTEDAAAGEGFLAGVVRDWEAATGEAREAGLRVVHVRTGLVLSDGGGSLLPQLPLFLAGVGGRLTARDARVSWITLDDMARTYAHAVLSSTLEGPLNAVAPGTVTAGEFARTLGTVLHRPALLPVPAVGPALVLGRAGADELIRTDQEVSGEHLVGSGFAPAHPELEAGLRHLLRRA